MSDNLQPLLSALAGRTRGAETPQRVLQALHAELAARRRRRLLWRWSPLAAVAAALLVVMINWTRPEPVLPAPPVVALEPAAPDVGLDRAVAPVPAVVALPVRQTRRSTTPWFVYSGLPTQAQGQVVNVEVSSATAATFGVVSVRPRVAAQVFVGDDGLVRAIRFVR